MRRRTSGKGTVEGTLREVTSTKGQIRSSDWERDPPGEILSTLIPCVILCFQNEPFRRVRKRNIWGQTSPFGIIAKSELKMTPKLLWGSARLHKGSHLRTRLLSVKFTNVLQVVTPPPPRGAIPQCNSATRNEFHHGALSTCTSARRELQSFPWK